MAKSRERASGKKAVNVGLAVLVVVVIAVWGFTLSHSGGPSKAAAFTPMPEITVAAPLRAAFLGDSLTAGTKFGGLEAKGWPAIVAVKHGWTTHLAGFGGTGFLSAGQSGHDTFSTRVDDVVAGAPNIVIVAGGMNDVFFSQSRETVAASAVLSSLRQRLPKAKIVLIAPLWTQQTWDPRMGGIHAALKTAAAQTGVLFVDTTGWFDGRADLIASDGVHPTDQGHAYLAGKIDAALRKLKIV
jgi:lysophospholipase L1-like esterase